MLEAPLSRREALGALAATTALPIVSAAPAHATPASEADAKAVLDSFAEHLLQLSPEGATSLGIDTGKRAPLRYKLGDHSPAAGQGYGGS